MRLPPEARVSNILPPAEGDTKPVSLRVPEMLLKRIDAISKASGHSRTDVMLHFLRWATQEYELEQSRVAAQADADTTPSGAYAGPRKR